ncbi:hypothetical protein EGW08_022984 [Elysia chlorotica]|uniref:Uncharacterized protein n=1 Tax=Elysia chlorotica TaxID=188477 RepID=A0A3S1AWQ3_ELYCH|nr:hypothetical protein EGW08_022984 [Elysia chlorotica]
MLAPLKTQGIDCGIESETGSEGGFDMGAGAGGPFESCTTGMQACTESLKSTISDGSIAKEPCKTMQTYVNCIFSLDCPIEESQKQEIVDKSIGQLNDQGFNCDIKYAGSGSSAGAETEYGSGPKTEPEGGAKVDEGIGTFTGPAGDFVMLMQVQALFVKHGCDKTFENCASEVKGSENEQMPSCSDIKKSGQCMFKECSDIKGSGDDTEVAKLLAKFASQSSKCEITAEDLIGSGALGVLQRPVWSSVLFVLVAVVTKTVLI